MNAEVQVPPVEYVGLPSGSQLAVRRSRARGQRSGVAVFVHGLGGSSTNWTDLVGALPQSLDCTALDLPGYGFSDPPPDRDYSLVGAMRAVVELIETLYPGQPVHLFGNSMGGAVAVQLAGRRPDLVATLCLVSPALPNLRPRATNVHLPVMTLPRVGDKMFDKYQLVGADRRVQATFDLCFADPARVPEQRRLEAEAEARRRDALPYIREVFIGSIRGLMASYFDRGPDRPWQLARRIAAPTLLVYGRRDKLVDAIAAHRATREFPNANVVVIPDSGHVSQMEHPEMVAASWVEFFGRSTD